MFAFSRSRKPRYDWKWTCCAIGLWGFFAAAAWAQSVDIPPPLAIGDKWTFRFHNKGDKREPFLFSNEVKSVEPAVAWVYGESQETNSQNPKYVWRIDTNKFEFVERFQFDPAAPNGAGKLQVDRKANDAMLQLPLQVGKKYTVKSKWDNGRGFDELTAEVQAFEKIKVEAGEFDVFRIKYSGFWNQREGGSYSGRIERMSWFAPAVKQSVKTVSSSRTSDGRPWNDFVTELVKWEPGAAK